MANMWRSTGAEALSKVLEAPPDVILLDYQIPDLNGVHIARQISHLYPQNSDPYANASSFEAVGRGCPASGRARHMCKTRHRVGRRSGEAPLARTKLLSDNLLGAWCFVRPGTADLSFDEIQHSLYSSRTLGVLRLVRAFWGSRALLNE